MRFYVAVALIGAVGSGRLHQVKKIGGNPPKSQEKLTSP